MKTKKVAIISNLISFIKNVIVRVFLLTALRKRHIIAVHLIGVEGLFTSNLYDVLFVDLGACRSYSRSCCLYAALFF